jgi:AGZA family xanthine/uracil permease-like MFS transporter
MTLLMGLYAQLPFAVAPGMGLNAFFASRSCSRASAVADGARHGVLVRRAVPARLGDAAARADRAGDSLAAAVGGAGGIGLLLTFIGLPKRRLIVGDPATLSRMGTLDHRAAFLLLGILSPCADAPTTRSRSWRRSFRVTALALDVGYANRRPPRQRAGLFLGVPAARHRGALRLALLPAIVAILFTDLFDSLSTFIGVATRPASPTRTAADQPARGLIVDALATLGSGWPGPRRNRVRGKHRRHPHGRAHRARVRRDGALLRALLFSRTPAAAVPATRPPRCSCWSASRCSSRWRRSSFASIEERPARLCHASC